MATIDPRARDTERLGMSRYCDELERRIAELEAAHQTIRNLVDAAHIRGDAAYILGQIDRTARDALNGK